MNWLCRFGLHRYTYSARVFPDGTHRAVRQCRRCNHYREWFGLWRAVAEADRGPWWRNRAAHGEEVQRG